MCKWVRLLPGTYLPGTLIWGCWIAVYRTLYIKAQNWVKYTIGESKLLRILIFAGILINVVFALLVVEYDVNSMLSKLCSHHSKDDLHLILDYKVRQFSQSLTNF